MTSFDSSVEMLKNGNYMYEILFLEQYKVVTSADESHARERFLY